MAAFTNIFPLRLPLEAVGDAHILKYSKAYKPGGIRLYFENPLLQRYHQISSFRLKRMCWNQRIGKLSNNLKLQNQLNLSYWNHIFSRFVEIRISPTNFSQIRQIFKTRNGVPRHQGLS